MAERSPLYRHEHPVKSSEFLQLNSGIQTFVDTMMQTGFIDKNSGSKDIVAWHATDMQPNEVLQRLESTPLGELLASDEFFNLSKVKSTDLAHVRLRVRSREWEKIRAEQGAYKRYPDEMDWEKGISIKLRYESENRVVRQFISLTSRSEKINQASELKRSFVPPDDIGMLDGLLDPSHHEQDIFSKNLYKAKPATPEAAKAFLTLVQEMYDKRSPVDDTMFFD